MHVRQIEDPTKVDSASRNLGEHDRVAIRPRPPTLFTCCDGDALRHQRGEHEPAHEAQAVPPRNGPATKVLFFFFFFVSAAYTNRGGEKH